MRRRVDVRATDDVSVASAGLREPSLRPDCWLRASPAREPAPSKPPTAAHIEQMYLNITPCQLYPRLRGTVVYGALLSTFRSALAGHPALKAFQARWYVAFTILSKRLAVRMHDCQKWRESHFCRRYAIGRGSDCVRHNWENWLRGSVGAGRAGDVTKTAPEAISVDVARVVSRPVSNRAIARGSGGARACADRCRVAYWSGEWGVWSGVWSGMRGSAEAVQPLPRRGG